MRSHIRTGLKFLTLVFFAGWLTLTLYQLIKIIQMQQDTCKLAQLSHAYIQYPDGYIDVLYDCPLTYEATVGPGV